MASYVKAAVISFEERYKMECKNFGETKSIGLTKIQSCKNPNFFSKKLSVFWKIYKQFLITSRFAGIPMALVYAVFIYLYLTLMILPDSDTSNLTEPEVKKKSTTSSCFSNEVRDLFPNDTAFRRFIKIQSNVDENISLRNQRIALVTSSALTLTIGISSVFSRHTRCILMLITPGILTGRGRAFLLTVVLGLLIEGPVNSINYNINQIIESIVCMYNSMKNMACRFTNQIQADMNYIASIPKEIQQKIIEDLKEIQEEALKASNAVKKDLEKRERELKERLDKAKKDLEKVKNIFNTIASPCNAVESVFSTVRIFFEDIFSKRRRRSVKVCGATVPFPDIELENMDSEALNELNKWAQDLVPEFNTKVGGSPDITKLFNAPSISDIRGKISNIIKDLFNSFQCYLAYIKKFCVLISLICLTISAVRYLLNYYSDDAYDNKFVDDTLRNLWRYEGYEKLTPIRRWELNEKFQVTASIRLSKKELKRMIARAFPTITMTVITLFLVIGDLSLTQLLKALVANGKFAISFKGMEEGFGAEVMFNILNENVSLNMKPLKLEKIDVSADPCLPRPLVTDKKKTIAIAVILIIMLLSSFFDAYAMRLRANICNIFYETRAKERAMYLHKAISTGRHARRIRLRMAILKELQRRKRRQEFSCLFKLIDFCLKLKKQKNMNCPGCFRKTKIEETTKVTVSDNQIKKACRLCNDCYKDY